MKYSRLLTLLGLSIIVVIGALGYFVIRVNAQEDIISDLTGRLTAQGIPLKEIKLQSLIPLNLEITLQRIDEQAKPLEPFYIHTVKREVTLARERGVGVDALTLVILNTKGDVEYWAAEPIKMINIENVLSGADNDRAAILVSEKLNLFDLKLENIDVVSDEHKTQMVSLQLSATDVETANKVLPQFMPSLRVIFDDLNKNSQTNIGVCKLDLMDEKGQSLLHYVLDLQLEQESWWMADGVTMDWFPHPLPESSTP